MKITVVVEEGQHPSCISEFGLSLFLENEGGTFLFDTGAGEALLPNLKALGIPLEKCKKVILSHGHYDHTGALAKLAPEELPIGGYHVDRQHIVFPVLHYIADIHLK